MKKMLLLLMISFQVFSDTLFVCQGNTGRSYIAEAIAQKLLYHQSFSRGLVMKSLYPEPKATEALAQWNIFYPHQAKAIEPSDVQRAELILTMTLQQKQQLLIRFPEYQNKIYMLSECADGQQIDVQDPFGKDLQTYENIRNQIFFYEDTISSRNWQCKTRSP